MLGRTAIGTVSSAYELRVDAGSLDLHRFERLVRDARALARDAFLWDANSDGLALRVPAAGTGLPG